MACWFNEFIYCNDVFRFASFFALSEMLHRWNGQKNAHESRWSENICMDQFIVSRFVWLTVLCWIISSFYILIEMILETVYWRKTVVTKLIGIIFVQNRVLYIQSNQYNCVKREIVDIDLILSTKHINIHVKRTSTTFLLQ